MTLLTPWGESLDRTAPLPDYPRPQLTRPRWLSLNGPWRYAIVDFTASDPLEVADPTSPLGWDGEIVVPFSPETPLSGVGRVLRADQTLWYGKGFHLPPTEPGERVLLHFGAVDQSCRVAVDGCEVGGHTGGYLSFTVDITGALDDRVDHELVVSVRDVTDTSWLSRGKQSSSRGGIWYTPQSGIWQTVWLEILPELAVDRLVLTPRLELSGVEVTVASDRSADGLMATVEVSAAGELVARAEVPVGTPSQISLPTPVRTWSPEDPFLYDVQVTLGGDSVGSYFGMRSFGVGRDDRGFPRLLLNGHPYQPVGLLDQGYWPDGGYTAPSDEALEYDIRLAKSLGFTMLRKHIKVEPLRWYHHCDRLGMLVWQDAVSGGSTYNPVLISAPAVQAPQISDRHHRLFGRRSVRGREQYELELSEMIDHLRSVPSLAVWVPFNEGWGQFDARRIAQRVRTYDPTRSVDHASGWHDQGAGDLRSLHVYFRPVRPPKRRDDRVLAITEYGGYSLVVPGHTWGSRSFGYRRFPTQDRLEAALVRLHDREIVPAIGQGVAATVYTQLADVEDEVNGLVTYDRRVVKVDVATIRSMTDRLRAAAAHDGGGPDDRA